MLKRCVTARRGSLLLALAGAALFSSLSAPAAEAHHWHAARHWYHIRHFQHAYFSHRHARHYTAAASAVSESGPKAAAIVVDANSGHTLYALNENELRHPASITKVMTLYLLFEQLEKGRLHLDSEIPVSRHAAMQPPTKLGLHPGQTIRVEDAIKAIVTRSANDMAVAVAEAIGGDEDSFAEMMTHKAHALGMSRTHYANASGLPNDEQITTAHDLAILGRAIQDRFPRYYHYFSTRVFYYAGTVSPNHNHLMDRIEGMDGIKTGYTRASGFNLLTSVKRDGHYIVAVVMGGSSAASRDRTMARLIEDQIDQGATMRTASAITENAEKVAAADREEQDTDDRDDNAAPSPKHDVQPALRLAPKPQPVKTEIAPPPVPVAPVQVASVNSDMPPVRPRPAVVSGVAKPVANDNNPQPSPGMGNHASYDGSTTTSLLKANGVPAHTATPSAMRWVVGPSPAVTKDRPDAQKLAKTERNVEVDRTTTQKNVTEKAEDSTRPPVTHTGWMIQIGATDDIAKANELLARAKSQGHRALNSAQPFTEKVQKGSETLYRARFAGLEADSAESACKSLKHSGFSCFATKN